MKRIFLSLSLIMFISNISMIAQTIEPDNNTGDVGLVTFTYQGNPVTYTTVRLGDGSVWLQQNLGSTQVAISSTDRASWGHWFQWGRWDDGHQVAIPNEANNGWSAGTSPNNNGMPIPNNPTGLGTGSNLFYYHATDKWWNIPLSVSVDGTISSDVTESNGCDPCKAIGAGWMMPSKEDWEAVKANTSGILGADANAITNALTAYESILKLPTPGIRSNTNGGRANLSYGMYWSSTADASTANDGKAFNFNFNATASAISGGRRGYGFSVRCVNKITTGFSTPNKNILTTYFENNNLVLNNLSTSDKDAVLSVFDIQGKLLLKENISEIPKMVLPIDIKQGVYIVNIQGERSFSIKLVK